MCDAEATVSGDIVMSAKIGISGWVAGLALLPGVTFATPSDMDVVDAWTAAGGKAGGEAPLYMTITNRGKTPDALTRVRCPVAWASEPRTTDRGEGGLTSRAGKSIAIPPDTTVKLEPGGFYVALLQLKDALREGDTFTCAVTFNGGPQDVPVRVNGAAGTPQDNR
jgi:periplasmic copper chaperone A